MKMLFATGLAVTATLTVFAQQPPPAVPDGYWPESRSAEILKNTRTIRLAPDLSKLPAEEQAALKELLSVGEIMQRLYEVQKHHQSQSAHQELRSLDARLGSAARTKNLRELYRLNRGPIATTLDNKREPFLPVDPELPGKAVYPIDVTRAELDAYMAANPDMREHLMNERTMVRRETKTQLGLDINALQVFNILRNLHPGLLEWFRSRQLGANGKSFYATPYTVAFADDLITAYNHMMFAAAWLEKTDKEFARYIRNRGRDFLTNDYESGDASWVTGRFQRLNAQIGAYETYDDALYGVKAFHSMSIVLKNEKATAELLQNLRGLQAIEDALPYDNRKRVKEDISVGVYDVIADFGQARTVNTATILPNDPLFSRRYGRTILMRENILRNPELFADDERAWKAAVADTHVKDLLIEGKFQRTLWHEVGHYLGVERDKQGRPLDEALGEHADALEEMKSDLVSLFALQRMNHPSLRAIQAAGIRRTLQNVQPRPDETYPTMQLAQFNYFLDKGLLTADPKTARLTIHYDRYSEVVNALLKEVLKLQHDGDKAAVAAFFQRWTTWTPELHEKIAARIRGVQAARWTLVRYAALGE